MAHRLVVLAVLGVLAADAALAASDAEGPLCRDRQVEPPLRVEACTRALALRDLTSEQHLTLLAARAGALDELGDYPRAIADYDSAIVLAPQDPVLYVGRGVAKIHDGRPADAIADYSAAIRLKPDWHLPYFNRAVALTGLGQRAAALADYERAIARKPDDAWIYVGQGDVHAASGDLPRALDSYGKALSLRLDLDDPRAKRASVLLRLDRPAEALPELDRVLATNPSKPHLWQARGEAKFQLARYADAAADFERALDLAPQNKAARRALARAQLGAGDVQAAWRTMVLEPDASDNEAADLTLAAMVALLTGRGSTADGLVRRAIAIKPGEATAQAVRALALHRQGKDAEARSAAALAVDFAPQDAEIAAIAQRMGSDRDSAPPALSRSTPAKSALADCVTQLGAGNIEAAQAAGAGWSLCHLAASVLQ